jgi:hypothetical protein
MEVVCSSKMLVDFQCTNWYYIQEDRNLHIYCCENLRSHIMYMIHAETLHMVCTCPMEAIDITEGQVGCQKTLGIFRTITYILSCNITLIFIMSRRVIVKRDMHSHCISEHTTLAQVLFCWSLLLLAWIRLQSPPPLQPIHITKMIHYTTYFDLKMEVTCSF